MEDEALALRTDRYLSAGVILYGHIHSNASRPVTQGEVPAASPAGEGAFTHARFRETDLPLTSGVS